MIKLDKVSKKFGTGVFALSDINLSVDKKEFVFLVGPTGSGKTTIFRLLTRELLPTEGIVIVNDWNIAKLPKQKIPHLRKKSLCVVKSISLNPLMQPLYSRSEKFTCEVMSFIPTPS